MEILHAIEKIRKEKKKQRGHYAQDSVTERER